MILDRLRNHSGVLALASKLLGASVLAQIAVLVATALASTSLHPSDFAIYGAVSGATGVSASLNTLAAETRTPVVDDAKHEVLNRAGFTALSAVSLTTLLAGIIAFTQRPGLGWILVLTSVCALMTGAIQLLTGIVLRQQRQSVLADGRVSQGLTNALMLVVLWQLKAPGFLVLTLSWLISLVVGASVLYLRAARGHLPRRPASMADMRELGSQVGGQPVANLLASSVSNLPPLLLPALGHNVTAGVWALVSRFLNPLVNTTYSTLQPLYYGKAASLVRDAKVQALRDFHRRWMTWLTLAGLPVVVASIVISMFLLPLLGPQWRVGWLPAITGAIYYTSTFSCLPLSQTLQMLGRVRLSLLWTVVRAIVCVLPLAFIPVLGGQRALFGWAVGAALTFYWQFWLHRRCLHELVIPRRAAT